MALRGASYEEIRRVKNPLHGVESKSKVDAVKFLANRIHYMELKA